MRHPWIVLIGLVAIVAALLASVAFLNNYQVKPDPTDRMFDLDHVVDIQIEIPAEDWNTLRRQHPNRAAVYSGEDAPRGYTYFKAFITIDGTRIGPVGIRKKGFIGSLSTTRPSLKVDFAEYVKGLDFVGVNRLTLNNNQQDPSCMHQILSYYLFRKADIAAPRCNYATVSVNGDYKGLYSNVEPIKKPFLRQHFKEVNGNLYEGHRSDFRPGWTKSFEKKTNKGLADRNDLDSLVKALEQNDDELIDAVGQIVDLDAFIRFWAMECLVGHWDGYAENLNNFYIYNDPSSRKFHFIPWGADSAWGDANDSLQFDPPASVRAMGFLSRRLYNHPQTSQRYRQTLNALLRNVWDESELFQLVDRLDPIVVKKQSPANPAYDQWLAKIRTFITDRRRLLEADLGQPATAWTFPLEAEPVAGLGEPRGTLNATFSTKWGPEQADMRNAFAGSTATFELKWDEEAPQFAETGALAQPFPELFRYGHPQLVIGGITKKDGHLLGASLIIDPESFAPGTELSIDAYTVMGDIIEIDFTSPQPSLKFRGSLSGQLKLDQASTAVGKQVSGTLEAVVR